MANGPNGIYYDLTDLDDTFLIQSVDPNVLASLPGGIRALGGNDEVIGRPVPDFAFGNLGNDILYGFGGNDTLWGGRDSDTLVGLDGDDNLNGNKGSDLVVGGAGNDLVRGGQDNDVLSGEAGNDTLIGDFGQDTMTGGADRDLFVLRRDTAVAPDASGSIQTDLIRDFVPGEDVIGLTGGLTEAQLSLIPLTLTVGETPTPSTAISFLEADGPRSLGVVLGRTPEELAGSFAPTAF